MDVVARIQELMNERGWTYYRLAKEAGLPKTTVSTMITRDNEPKISTIEACCKALGVSLSEFFAEDFDSGEFSLEERKLLKDLRNSPPNVVDGIKQIAASSAKEDNNKNLTT